MEACHFESRSDRCRFMNGSGPRSIRGAANAGSGAVPPRATATATCRFPWRTTGLGGPSSPIGCRGASTSATSRMAWWFATRATTRSASVRGTCSSARCERTPLTCSTRAGGEDAIRGRKVRRWRVDRFGTGSHDRSRASRAIRTSRRTETVGVAASTALGDATKSRRRGDVTGRRPCGLKMLAYCPSRSTRWIAPRSRTQRGLGTPPPPGCRWQLSSACRRA